VLHLACFGLLKRYPGYELPFDGDNTTVKVMMKVSHDFAQTMVQSNVWGSFWALGLEFDTRRALARLLFDDVRLTESAGFQELWSVDFPRCIAHNGPGHLSLSQNTKSRVWCRPAHRFL
jgi:hypothetical protein